MRHGEAETRSTVDKERMLTENGMRMVRHQARTVFAEELPDKFLVGESMRTRQTMEHLQEALDIPDNRISYEPIIYQASIRELFALVCRSDELWGAVCLIGHNPAISYLAEYLTGEAIGNLTPGGIVKMTLGNSWKQLTQNAASHDFYLPAE